jgi:MprA protease rhombosortase-interaction domain-containing protein
VQHAGLWFGTASSFINLEQFLPPGYSSSTALSIDWYDNKLWIGGYGVNNAGYAEAFLWTGIPAPSTAALLLAAGALAHRRRRPRSAKAAIASTLV